jgi:uncharacterized protein Yka (UPF0111/DUF47 family)
MKWRFLESAVIPTKGFFSGLVHGLGWRTNIAFVNLLRDQVDATKAAAIVMSDAIDGRVDQKWAYERMKEIEHEGDAIRAQLIRELSTALVTPIDREDLFRLSRSIDDVLDDLRDLMREWSLYGMKDSQGLSSPVAAVIRAVQELSRAVDAILREPEGIVEAAFVAKKAATRIHRLYQADMAALLRQPVSSDLLKQRELLRRLESVSLHVNEAADVLSDASIKRD